MAESIFQHKGISAIQNQGISQCHITQQTSHRDLLERNRMAAEIETAVVWAERAGFIGIWKHAQ